MLLIGYVLGLYKKSALNVVAVMANRFALNKAVACQMGHQLICCVGHRLYLAVKDIITEHCLLIDGIRTTSGKL